MESDAAREYARRFARLRTNKNKEHWTRLTKNQAPHKPLLLLSVLDLFDQGVIASSFVELTPELSETFGRYWNRVLPLDRRGNLALPFFHLRSEGFWNLCPRRSEDRTLNTVPTISSLSKLQEVVFGAHLEDSLYKLMKLRETRDLLRSVLVETYFAPEAKAELAEQGIINREAFLYSEELLESAGERIVREASAERAYQPAARDQGFRRAVVTAYEHRCAMCGIRVRTLEGHTVVDAAHIVPWSVDQDDRPANGLALCRTCHWAFDEGMLGVSAGYEVVASGHLRSASNLAGYLDGLKGKAITPPKAEGYLPDLGSLKWHREHVFLAL